MVRASELEPPERGSDRDLVGAAARGDAAALSELYDRFAALLVTVATRMLGDRAVAEDVVHDVFLEVWRHAHAFDPARGTVRSWILVRLRSRALDRLRSAPVRREVSSADVGAVEHGGAPGEDPGLAPDRTAAVAALSRLPPDQRRVLELAYFQGFSSAEIADHMGTPLGTVKSRTAAALAKLRLALDDGRGVT